MGYRESKPTRPSLLADCVDPATKPDPRQTKKNGKTEKTTPKPAQVLHPRRIGRRRRHREPRSGVAIQKIVGRPSFPWIATLRSR